MTLVELYEALSKLENGAEMISAVKTEISRLNGESAKFRTSKNEADAKITELTAKVEELEAKGTGDQTAAEKMQKQLDELNKKYEAAENARKEEQAKRVQADIMQQTVAALTKGNAANPAEIAKILVGSIKADEDGIYKFTNAKNESVSIEDGATGWLKDNAWAVKDTQNPGSGGGNGGNGRQAQPQAGLHAAVAAALNK